MDQYDDCEQPLRPNEKELLKIKGLKRCFRCKNVKELTQFWVDRSRLDGRSGICRECRIIYIPEEAICLYCKKWFTKKRRNNKFCSKLCLNRHYCNIYNKSTKREVERAEYYRKNREKVNNRAKEWYRRNRMLKTD